MAIKVVIAVFRYDSLQGFPYDIGDDPSFRASERFRSRGGVLTWGVCRPNVRNDIVSGDMVVYFATERSGLKPTASYRFVG